MTNSNSEAPTTCLRPGPFDSGADPCHRCPAQGNCPGFPDDADDDTDDEAEPEIGICGCCCASVPAGDEPVRGNGWYSGHQYRWGGNPHRPILLRVRCPECREALAE